MIQAIELGIFDELEANPKPLTARALANKKDFNLLMTEKLLNSLSCIGLLKKTKGKDGNSILNLQVKRDLNEAILHLLYICFTTTMRYISLSCE